VASIHPSSPDGVAAGWSGISNGSGRTKALNVTLKGTIADAFGIREDHVPKSETGAVGQPVGRETLKAMVRSPFEVIDRPGLKCAFNFTLCWNADPLTTGDRVDAASDLQFRLSRQLLTSLP